MTTEKPNARQRSVSMRHKMDARLKVLREWAVTGVPDAVTWIPGSLTQVRRWDAPELAIEPIGSPNAFTTQDRTFGADVLEIAALVQKLRACKAASKQVARKTKDGSSGRQTADREAELRAAISQWHSERDRVVGLESEINRLRLRLRRNGDRG